MEHFEPGAELVYRCVDIGGLGWMQKMEGKGGERELEKKALFKDSAVSILGFGEGKVLPAWDLFPFPFFIRRKKIKEKEYLFAVPFSVLHGFFSSVFLGKYALKGSVRRRCVGVTWDGKAPSCEGLNQVQSQEHCNLLYLTCSTGLVIAFYTLTLSYFCSLYHT